MAVLDTDHNGCSSSVIITSQPSTATKRNSAVVIAEDKRTGKTLRCDVFLDTVTSVAMKTRTRTINKGDEELLEIQGFDSLGNVFSSLEGLIFQWTFTPSAESASSFPALKVIPFSESTISVSPVLEELEARNIQSSSVLVQGADIGQVDVSARLVNHGTAVAPVTVQMAILQPLHLEPVTPLYLTPDTVFNYTLYTRKKDLQMLVTMPDPRYKWRSSDARVASVDERGRVHTKALGNTQVSVSFGVATPSFADAGASRWVFVVEPASLTLRITPANESDTNSLIAIGSKVLIQGQPYRFDVEMFDADLHKVDVTSHTVFELAFDTKFFEAQSHTANHEHSVMKTRELTGTTTVTVRVKSIAGKPPKRPLVASQEILVTAPVRVEPTEILLPYVAGGEPHQLALRASGGSGEYKWAVGDNLVASVSPAGVVSALARGATQVTVVDARNKFNVAHASLRVAEPASLSFVPHPVEVKEGESLALEIVAKDHDGNPFANCTALPFTWTLDPPESVPAAPFVLDSIDVSLSQQLSQQQQQQQQQRKPLTAGACMVRTLHSRAAGQTAVAVSLPGKRYVPIETRIFAFKPLRIVTPQPPAPVAPGSSLTYVLAGGPAPWYLDPSAFEESCTAAKPSAVRVRTPGPAHRGQFIATCASYSRQQLTFTAGNKPRQALQFPATSTVNTTFDCVEPYRLLLRPVGEDHVPEAVLRPAANKPSTEKGNEENSATCASMLGTFVDDMVQLSEGAPLPEVYHLRYNQTYRLSAVLVDAAGHAFANASSVHIEWAASTVVGADGRAVIAARWDGTNATERELKLLPVEGTVHVRVAATGYNSAHMQGLSVPKLGSPLLARNIRLVLHRNVEVVPAAVSIVNHPRNSLVLEARHGSGNYIFSVDDARVATIEHAAGTATARLVPRRPGTVRVTVTDACLSHSEPAVATVHVADVETLELAVPDLLQLGETTTLVVTALDPTGTPFDPSQYQFLNIRVGVDNAGLTLEDSAVPGRYVMRGAAVGASALTATLVCETGKVVTSNPAQVYVFAPFALHPARVHLVPGARYHLRWTGGPPVRHDIAFASADGGVVAVDGDALGMITAGAVGSTTVTATISATHSLTHERLVFGRATVEVSVQHLRGLRLRSATNRLVIGGEETVWVEGYGAGETPLTLAGVGIRFAWTAGDPHVVSLRGAYEEAGYALEDEASAFSARVVARSPGQTAVTVAVAALPPSLPAALYKGLSATLQVGVAEPLRILAPAPALLLPPHARLAVRTNKDGAARLRYTLVATHDAPIARVSAQGVVETLSAFGSAVVVVHDVDAGETASIMVTVKPVAQLQLVPAPGGGAGRDIPVGASMQFQTVLRDDVGLPFHALPRGTGPGSAPVLTVETNFPDTIAVTRGADNTTVTVKALRPGQPVLHAALAANPAIEDYLRVYVGHMVEPLNPIVHCGGSVAFHTSFDHAAAAARGSRRVWSAEDPAVVRIDAQNGVARAATQPGSTTVYYKGAVFAFTQVRVERVARVDMDDNNGASPVVILGAVPSRVSDRAASTTGSATATGAGTTTNKLHLSFYAKSGEKFTRALTPSIASTGSGSGTSNNGLRPQINHNFQVQCSVVERAWATAQAVVESSTGETYCQVQPAASVPTGSPSAPDTLTVRVAVTDTAGSYAVENTFHVKFLPRFVVVGDRARAAPARSVTLTTQATHQTLTVLFPAATLTVVPTDSSLVSVTTVAPGTYDIDVQPTARGASFTTTVELRDSASGQAENVTVLYRYQTEPAPRDRDREHEHRHGRAWDGAGTIVDGGDAEPAGKGGRSPVVFYLVILSVVLITISAIVLRSSNDEAAPPLVSPQASFAGSMSGGYDNHARSAMFGANQVLPPVSSY